MDRDALDLSRNFLTHHFYVLNFQNMPISTKINRRFSQLGHLRKKIFHLPNPGDPKNTLWFHMRSLSRSLIQAIFPSSKNKDMTLDVQIQLFFHLFFLAQSKKLILTPYQKNEGQWVTQKFLLTQISTFFQKIEAKKIFFRLNLPKTYGSMIFLTH